MRESIRDRAWAALGDYAYEMNTGDVPQRRSAQSGAATPRAPMAARPAHVKLPTGILSEASTSATYAAIRWEYERSLEWKRAGRITEDGALRVGRNALNRYTQADLMRIMPHLNVFDRMAVLIDLDGVVEEGYMDTHENIREVVRKISRDEMEVVMASPAAQSRIADIVHEQVGAIFGVLLQKLNTPAAGALNRKGGGRQFKCSICKEPGHRAPTCGKKKDIVPPDESAT